MNSKNLISKIISGNASSSEIKKFQNWLNESEENKNEYQQSLQLWQLSSDLSQKDDDCDVESAWLSFLENKDEKVNRSSQLFYKIAAVFIVLLTVGSISSYLLFRNNDEVSVLFSKNLSQNINEKLSNNSEKILTLDVKKEKHSIYLKNKQKRNKRADNFSEYVLIDSSNIKLTDNSALKFLDQDKQNSRIASLMGAGIFDIKPSNQLFILETEHVIIHVEGTKFRVNDPKDDFPYVELYVNEGSMEVFEKKNISNNITLTSGQKYLFDINKKQFIQVVEKTKKQNKWKLFWKRNKNNLN